MGDDPRWKRRLPSRIYNYNYKVSEGYYKPQAEFMETKQYDGRGRKSPPRHQSYAERFANNPWYGGTAGLPYNEYQSAGPLIKLADRSCRSSSLLREMKELEDEGIPLYLRASRRKKRAEEEEELSGIRQRYNRNYPVEDKPDTESKVMRSNEFHSQVMRKIKNLDDELLKSTRTASTIVPQTKWSYDLDRVSSSMRHNRDDRISSLYTGDKFNKSYSDASQYSSKPPIIPSRTRKVSESEDFSFQPLMRVNSISSLPTMAGASRRSIEPEELVPYSNRAPIFKEERRHREARDMNDDICKKVDMMRARNVDVDPLVSYSQGRHSRSSSVDRTHKRRGSRSNTSRYVYGIGKI